MEIIIYGAGNMGSLVYEKLKEDYPEERVIAFADSKKDGEQEELQILSMCNLQNEFSNLGHCIIVVAMKSIINAFEVAKKLYVIGYRNIFYFRNLTVRSADGFLKRECLAFDNMSDDVLPHLEMHVCDYCNLNCRGCNNYSPIFEKKLPDTGRRLNDLSSIKKLFSKVYRLYLIGGEPLLNPELGTYISTARELFPDTDIHIVTNGLLIPKMEERLLETIRKNRVFVSVTLYEPTKRIWSDIEKLLTENNINYSVFNLGTKDTFFRPLTLKSNSEYENVCLAKGCISVADGKIARCESLLFIDELNKKFGVNFSNDGVLKLDDYTGAGELMNELKKDRALCKSCVKCEIKWASVGNNSVLTDFVEI